MIVWRSYLIILNVHHNLSVNIPVNSLFVSISISTSIHRDIIPVKNIYRDIIPVESVHRDINLVESVLQNIHRDIIPVKIVSNLSDLSEIIFQKYFSKVKSFLSPENYFLKIFLLWKCLQISCKLFILPILYLHLANILANTRNSADQTVV